MPSIPMIPSTTPSAAVKAQMRQAYLLKGSGVRGFVDNDHEQPGDLVVSLDMKTVYIIDQRGARRRVDDPSIRNIAISRVRSGL